MTKPAAQPAKSPSPKTELVADHAVLAVRPAEKLFPVNDGPLFDPEYTPPRARRPRKAVKTAAPVRVDTPAPKWITSAQPLTARPKTLDAEPEATPITAIETRYGGCRFRSRLEARYAVWFDHLGMEWQYEPETFLVGPEGRRRGYLPDFYLPDQGVWVEAKGSEHALNYRLLADAAHPAHGLPLDPGGVRAQWPVHALRIAVLGPVPAAPSLHAAFALISGSVVVQQLTTPFCRMSVAGRPEEMAKPHEHELVPMYHPFEVDPDDEQPDGLLTAFGYGITCPQVVGAYTAARSARFEHGESG